MSSPQLRLYNTLTRSKEAFAPIDPQNVRMYVCGPTVYDFAHIGNARPAIVFDVLYRLLRHLYGETHVTYVRNITDVDDKINDRAARDFPGLPLNEAIRRVTETTATQYQADTKALGCLEPDVQPRATDNIVQMIDVIRTLIAKGHAYVAAGEVLFEVSTMADYGRLSRRVLDEQQAGARVAVEAHKRNPADFVLWKLSSENEPGWESPWGRGRPGWHIECSAMSNRYLGETFDIHGGGLDLIFPHHENEIAQSRCAFGHDVMANVWMHNGFLQVEGEKMSKSLGNFVTINDALDQWGGAVLKMNMLKTHYRSPIDWTIASLHETARELAKWADAIHLRAARSEKVSASVVTGLLDDLNIHLSFTEMRRQFKAGDIDALSASLSFLGIGTEPSNIEGRKHKRLYADPAHIVVTGGTVNLSVVRASASKLDEAFIDSLIKARLAARKARNFAESDRIRDELLAMGIQIMDAKDPVTGELTTKWEVKR